MNRMLVSIILFVVAVISYGATPEQKSESQKVRTNTNVVLSFKEDSDTDGYRWVYVASKDKNETKKYKVVKDSSRFLIQDKEDKFEFIFLERGLFVLEFRYVNIRNKNEVKSILKQTIDARENVKLNWIDDFAKAKQTAAAENKPIFLLFTGSDWCRPCKALERNLVETKEFKEYADKNLVLMKTEYLKHSEQSSAEKARHSSLRLKYEISGYPTTFILDSEGKALLKITVYNKDNWMNRINETVKNNTPKIR